MHPVPGTGDQFNKLGSSFAFVGGDNKGTNTMIDKCRFYDGLLVEIAILGEEITVGLLRKNSQDLFIGLPRAIKSVWGLTGTFRWVKPSIIR